MMGATFGGATNVSGRAFFSAVEKPVSWAANINPRTALPPKRRRSLGDYTYR